jgi:hypothetical protein
MTKVVKGYVVQLRRAGQESIHRDELHIWGEPDQLPAEWEEVKNDETVEYAEIMNSSQRRVRAEKRKLLDRFSRE